MEKVKNFVREHKALVAISSLVVVIAIVIAILLLFGNDEKLPTSGSDTTVDVSTESTEDNSSEDDDYLSGIGTAPDDSSSESNVDDKDNADEFPNGDKDSETNVNPDEDEDSESSTTPVDPDNGDDKNSEENTEPTEPDDEPDVPVHSCNYNTLKNDANNHWYVCSCGKTANKSAHNYSNDSDATCNTCGYTREVHTCKYNTLKNDANNHWYVCSCGKTANKSAHNYSSDSDATCDTCGYTRTIVTPEPEKPATVPSVSWTGGDITLGSLGINIPTLKDFNDEALGGNATDGYGWTGAQGTEEFKTLDNSLYNVRTALVNKGVLNSKTGNAFTISNYSISFDWASYSSNHDFELKRDPNTGVYTLIINDSLTDSTWEGKDISAYNRDIVLTMCTVFSSQAQTVYNTLYQDLYGTECISMTSYTSVGDCKIKYDNSQSYDGHYVYLIKAK